MCFRRCSGLKPGLFGNDRRTGAIRADSDSTSSSFALQTVEHSSQDGPHKRSVKIEDSADGQIRYSRILQDERSLIQVQPLCALLGALNVGRLQLDPYAASVGTNRNQQGNMAQPGAKIDENIGCGEGGQVDQAEEVARRGGRIEHLLGIPRNVPGVGFFELKTPLISSQ